MKNKIFYLLLLYSLPLHSYANELDKEIEPPKKRIVFFFLRPATEFNCRIIGKWMDDSKFPVKPAWDMD